MLSLISIKDGKYTPIPDLEDQPSHVQEAIVTASAQADTDEPKSGGLIFSRNAKWLRLYGVLISLIFIIALSIMILPKNGDFERLMASQSIPFEEIDHPDPPKSFWKDLQGPLPTGAFWTNFVLEEGQAPANLHPYGVKCLREGVQTSYNPTRRVVNELVVSDPFDNDLELSAVEEYIDRKVVSYDSLSVTMQYYLMN